MKYNDYELIYLYKEGNTNILNLILYKYIPLIQKFVRMFELKEYDMEDYIQEGQMIICSCVELYSDRKGLFYSYCKSALFKRFYSMKNRRRDVLYTLGYNEEISILKENSPHNPLIDVPEFQELLKIKSIGIKDYAQNNNLEIKNVYNYIYELKKRIKKHKL